MKTIFAVVFAGFLAGCNISPLKPGWSSFSSPTGVQGVLQQPENPATASTQKYRVEVKDGVRSETIETSVGAAQKDTGREIAAKLSSLKGVVWLGVLVFLFGVASAFYPPLKLIVGSVTTSAACAAAGLALIFLPALVVGHELLILCVAAGAVGLYWWSHRHGELRGKLKTLERTE